METLVKKAEKNGTAKTKAVVKKDNASKIGAKMNTSVIKKGVKQEVVDEKPKFTLEERIQKVEELRGLTLKRNVTVKTLNDLRTFSFTANDSCSLEISDSTHRNFTTSNSNLIKLLTSHLGSLLKNKITDLDAKIIEFEI